MKFGVEWLVWWENGERHVIIFPWWGYLVFIAVVSAIFWWRSR